MSVRIDFLTMADTALIVTALAVLAGRLTDQASSRHCLRLARDIADGIPSRHLTEATS